MQGLKPNTFEELATCVHDMKLSITIRRDQQSLLCRSHKDEDIDELQSGVKYTFENEFKESMHISTLLTHEDKLQVVMLLGARA